MDAETEKYSAGRQESGWEDGTAGLMVDLSVSQRLRVNFVGYFKINICFSHSPIHHRPLGLPANIQICI